MAIQGGRVSIDQRAGVVVGAGAIFTNDGEVCSGARSTAAIAAPTLTASTSAVMMGLAGTITPNAGGNVQIMINGDFGNSVATDGGTLQIAYGTGAAPANGAAATGTVLGGVVKATSATAGARVPFCLIGYVTGLLGGTAYWIDVQLAAVTGGNANIADVTIVATEV
jgi:hypothetical protein